MRQSENGLSLSHLSHFVHFDPDPNGSKPPLPECHKNPFGVPTLLAPNPRVRHHDNFFMVRQRLTTGRR